MLINFNLLWYHKISISEIESMIPWERDVYLDLIANKIKEEKK